MKEIVDAELKVNGSDVELNPFVEDFLARTVMGAVSSLRGPQPIRELQVSLEGEEVQITVNADDLPLTPFPRQIIASTLLGLVSSLKGVGKVKSLNIHVKVR